MTKEEKPTRMWPEKPKKGGKQLDKQRRYYIEFKKMDAIQEAQGQTIKSKLGHK